jgi:hypothetical protein
MESNHRACGDDRGGALHELRANVYNEKEVPVIRPCGRITSSGRRAAPSLSCVVEINPRRASKVGYDRRDRCVETDDIDPAGAVRVRDGEPVRRRPDHDQLGRNSPCVLLRPQSLRRVHATCPGLVVGVDTQRVDPDAVLAYDHKRVLQTFTSHRLRTCV